MLQDLLKRVLTWAQWHNIPVEADVWQQAVTAWGQPVTRDSWIDKTNALQELLDGIKHPTVILWGARTPEHMSMHALQR